MRLPLAALLLLVASLPPARAAEPPNPRPLTPEEAADGWVQLFDGRDFSGLLIEGDAAVVDGVLVVGGAKPASVGVKKDLGDNFELRLFCRVEGQGALMFRARTESLGASSEGAFSVPTPPSKPGDAPEWREVRCVCRRNPTDHTCDIHLESLRDGQMTGSSGMGMSGDVPEVRFDVPAGTKLLLQRVTARPDPAAGSWRRSPWAFPAVLLVALLVLVVAVLLFVRRMRRRMATPVAPPLGPEPPLDEGAGE